MAFNGWPVEAIEFFERLEDDNTKAFWTEHKPTYEECVKAPMEALLAELAKPFGEGKIFRPHRDVRFSKDKTPYKTNIAATMARGGYVSLSADGFFVGTGYYMMAKDQLAAFRDAIVDDDTGSELEAIGSTLARARIDMTAFDSLKTAPRGYPKDHPRIELLRHKGLVAMRSWAPAKWLHTSGVKKRIVEFTERTQPMVDWLDANVGPSELEAR